MKVTSKRILCLLLVFALMFGMAPQKVSAAGIGKVKSVSTKTQYKTYKGITTALDMKYKKIKYKYGIKASWKKVKKASGYEIYVYGVASKKWRKIKDTKKTSYTFTNLLRKDQFKFKVRAYRKVNGQKVYGDWSKSKKVKAPVMMTKITNGGHRKKVFYDRYSAEQAFVLQNKYRKEKGVEPLVWSDALYEICKVRCKEIVTNYSHDNFMTTSENVLRDKYGLTKFDAEYEDENGYIIGIPYAAGENIARIMSIYTDVMQAWKKSSGHYRNLTNEEYKSGAIACYRKENKNYWVAIFGGVDLDKEIQENK